MLARLFRSLGPFDPTLVGTFPLGLQVDGSDLDVVCACADLDEFERSLRAALADLGVVDATLERVAGPALVAGFTLADVAVEVFAAAVPVHAQAGFRHMVIEARLLALGGPALRSAIRSRKQAGQKTEPAFAQLLGLDGDPYAALLALETWPHARLAALVADALAPAAPATISVHTGDRADLLPLLRLADDSDQEIAGYRDLGVVLVAAVDADLVGHVQLIADDATTWELKSLAVVDAERRRGLGRRLVEAGLAHARERGAARVTLSTGAADTRLLRFYQRLGFRLVRVDRDVFTPAAGYPPGLFVDGVRLLDRVWLDRTF